MAGLLDSYNGDDLDANLVVIEDDFLEINAEIIAEVNTVVAEIIDVQAEKGYSCEQCDKVCKTKRGLRRHVNTKHAAGLGENDGSVKPKLLNLFSIHLFSKQYIDKCALKLSTDECYSESTRKKLSNYVAIFDNANYSYQYGDGEKCYPDFLQMYCRYRGWGCVQKSLS